jgi:hypothetical protein
MMGGRLCCRSRRGRRVPRAVRGRRVSEVVLGELLYKQGLLWAGSPMIMVLEYGVTPGRDMALMKKDGCAFHMIS